MTGPSTQPTEWTSLNQLVQEIIGGAGRRHTFTQWDLELLFDLQNCNVKKSARPELLRHYVKAVQQQLASGVARPMRLATFVERENAARAARNEAAIAKSRSGLLARGAQIP